MGTVKKNIHENKTKGTEIEAFCSDCNRKKSHVVLVSTDTDGSEEYDEDSWISWSDNYQVIQCKACETLSFRHLSWFSEYEDHDCNGESETLYPKRSANSLIIKEFDNMPKILRQIYKESIEAFNNECFMLCAVGLRGVVEGICAVKSVKDGPVEKTLKDGSTKIVRSKRLDGKIAGLCEQGILTNASADILHEHRFLGNDAAHELEQPSVKGLKIAIEIIEHILEQLFEIPQKAVDLKDIRLSRLSRKKSQI